MTDLPTLTPDQIPPFVGGDPVKLLRWRLAFGVAQQIAGADDLMLAEMIYNSSAPTTDPMQEADLSDAEHEERVIAGKASAAKRHAEVEARHGMEPIGRAPKPTLTPEEMAQRGYDSWPAKGEVAREVLGKAGDTQILHRPAGDLSHVPVEYHYTDARMASVHEPIIRALTAGHASQTEPHALIIGGGPASGKSVFLNRAGSLVVPHDAVNLNADDIAFGTKEHDGIPEARDMMANRDPYAAVGSHREAGDILEKTEAAAVKNRQHIVLDATGNGDKDEFVGQLKRLHDSGYKVDLLYVSAPTDRAVEQNIYRAETQGRYVPTPVVRDKHRRVVENFKHIATQPYVDSVRVYDPERGLVAFRNEHGEMEPTHEEGYAQWMAKADEPPVDVPALRRGKVLSEAAKSENESMVIGVPFELQSREAAHREADDLLKKQAAQQRG